MDYSKYIGKAVEGSNDGEKWCKGILTSICIDRRIECGICRAKPIYAYTLDHVFTVSQIRPVRKFKVGDKIILGKKNKGVVTGYSKNGMLKVDIDGLGYEWMCEQDKCRFAPEPFFAGLDLQGIVNMTVKDKVLPGQLICVAEGAPLGFVMGVDFAVKEKPVRKFELGQTVSLIGSTEILGTIYHNSVCPMVKLSDGSGYQSFNQNKLSRCRKFKCGQNVKLIGTEEYLGYVLNHCGGNDVMVYVEPIDDRITLDKAALELYEEPLNIKVGDFVKVTDGADEIWYGKITCVGEHSVSVLDSEDVENDIYISSIECASSEEAITHIMKIWGLDAADIGGCLVVRL